MAAFAVPFARTCEEHARARRQENSQAGKVTADVMRGSYDWLASEGVVDMQLPADAWEPKMFMKSKEAA